MHKMLFLKPNQVEQINTDARERESVEEENGANSFPRRQNLPLWEGACYSTQEAGVILCLAGLLVAPMPSCFPGIGALFGIAVPPSPWEHKHSSATPELAPAQSQGPAVLLGLSLERDYEHINHSSEKFLAIGQEGKQSICISLPLSCVWTFHSKA